MNKTTLLLIGGAVIVGLLLIFRGNSGVTALGNKPATASFSPFGIFSPPAGPNTPTNTSGTAPYKPFSMTSSPGGPSVVAASLAGASGLISALGRLFQNPSSANLPAGPGQGALPSGTGLSDTLLGYQSQSAINPGALPIPLPAITPAQANPNAFGVPAPLPPDISQPGISPVGVDLSALYVAPPSPLTSPNDFGASMDAAITNPSYYTVPSATVADYSSPSYVYDGGELTASTG